MRKASLLIPCVVLLGSGIAWLLLRNNPSPLEVTSFEPDKTPHEVPHDEVNATLLPSERGRYEVTGIVLDEAGVGVVGVPIEIWHDSKRGAFNGHGDHNERSRQRILNQRAWIQAGSSRRGTLAASTTSARDGTFSIEFEMPFRTITKFNVFARPLAPLFGDYDEVWLQPNEEPHRPSKKQHRSTTLLLERGTPLEGKVISDRGDAMDASILITSELTGRVCVAQSKGPHGAFEFAGEAAGWFRFDVTIAPDRRCTGIRLPIPLDEPFVVELPTGAKTIKGIVVDSRGVPIDGAVLLLTLKLPPSGGTQSALHVYTTSNELGQYVFDALPRGDVVSVSAVANGFRVSEIKSSWNELRLESTQDADTHELNIELSQGATFVGRVTEVDSDRPISNAKVSVFMRHRTRPPRFVKTTLSEATDKDGHYRIEGLGHETYRVIASHPDYYMPDAFRRTSRGGDQTLPTYPLRPSNDNTSIEANVALARGTSISGTVIDASGQPTGDVEVLLGYTGTARQADFERNYVAWNDLHPKVLSKPDGSFTFRGVHPHDRWKIFAQGKEGTSAASKWIKVEHQSVSNVAISLLPPHSVAGVVLDARGEPISKVQVRATSVLPTVEYATSTTDAHGRFKFNALNVAHTKVVAQLDRFRAHAPLEGAGQGKTQGDLVLQFDGAGSVTGEVFTRAGTPVALLVLFLVPSNDVAAPMQSKTERDGSFKFENVMPGSHKIVAQELGWAQGTIYKYAYASSQHLRLRFDPVPLSTIKVRALDPNGDLVPHCKIEVRTLVGPPDRWSVIDGVVKKGYFEFSQRVTPIMYAWATQPKDAKGVPLPYLRAIVEITDSDAPVVVQFKAGASLGGRVVGPNGRGIEGTRIQVGILHTVTDAHGRWRLDGIRKDEASDFFVKPPTGFCQPEMITYTPGNMNMAITLKPGLSVSGRLFPPDDGMVIGGTVLAFGQEGDKVYTGSIASDGSFTVGVGTQAVLARIEIRPTQPGPNAQPLTGVTLRNIRAGARNLDHWIDYAVSISGIVVGPDGAPLPSGTLYLEGNALDGIRIGSDGRFEVSGIRPDVYEPSVKYKGRIYGHLDMMIAPGQNLRIEVPSRASK